MELSPSNYQHRDSQGNKLDFPVGKVVCIGRNYAEHARELNNPVPERPLLFIKPATALVDLCQPIQLAPERGPTHFETELALLIGQPLTRATPEQACDAIAALGLGLDLTLRELQSELKQKGHPWELAKAFDGSCPISPLVPIQSIKSLDDCRLQLLLDSELRQDGSARQMITPIAELLAYISRHFTLQPGDLVLTGTPAGVGQLQVGQQLELRLLEGEKLLKEWRTEVV
ncbi:fumarylacetoacetate hydrolase family protein [Motiliproteus sp.]|uniref:fumarylacetoacetate hydrolase family protein n=1 Tax=Motiliproteus sp. TaxID=1898955 RepID=UPI003BACB372